MLYLGINADQRSELHLQTAMETDTKIEQLSVHVTTLAISNQTQLVPKADLRTNDAPQNRSSQQLRTNECDHCRNIGKRSRSPRVTSILSFSLKLPSWLMQHSLKISLCRAAQNWTLNLRPYRTIPCDADIWDAIARNDFDRTRNLIESGQATVFDRDDGGYTLLHVCFGPFLQCF